MGTKSRQRRKAKRSAREKSQRQADVARQRAAGRATGGASSWPREGARRSTSEDLVAALLQEAAHARCDKSPERERLVARLVDAPAGVVARQLHYRVVSNLVLLLLNGWEPTDLWEISRRRAGALGASLAAAMTPEAVATSGLDDRVDSWNAQCVAFENVRPLAVAAPDWPAQVEAAADLVGVLEHLGALPRLDDTPAAAPAAQDPARASLLAKIKRLLAMAESTEFADEADSFTAKATAMMVRHRIDRAAVEASSGIAEVRGIVARRCWIEPPYVDQKSLLCHVVAEASNCRAVWHDYGFSTLVGHEDDVDMAELLFASLLVQATRQMTAVGAPAPVTEAAARADVQALFAAWERGGGLTEDEIEKTLQSTITGLLARERRNPSFRRSFLVAYATRIEQRLAELGQDATAAAEAELGTSFLPVLARQEQEVDDAVNRLFSRLGRSRLRTTNRAGWAAGRAAADLADLNVRDELRTG